MKDAKSPRSSRKRKANQPMPPTMPQMRSFNKTAILTHQNSRKSTVTEDPFSRSLHTFNGFDGFEPPHEAGFNTSASSPLCGTPVLFPSNNSKGGQLMTAPSGDITFSPSAFLFPSAGPPGELLEQSPMLPNLGTCSPVSTAVISSPPFSISPFMGAVSTPPAAATAPVGTVGWADNQPPAQQPFALPPAIQQQTGSVARSMQSSENWVTNLQGHDWGNTAHASAVLS
eukprot:TRINITY_DN3105_c0_g1_i5.p1 TRINITY_DN3105_c0_g1~~TRINITY_DN3105_c0_g1_i5.p1  ORF type:complete len:228 (-),score=35.21 TRINITY_DN3105_c0_g1_i5:119-802(-)